MSRLHLTASLGCSAACRAVKAIVADRRNTRRSTLGRSEPMNEREKRDFQAGLEQEVDAFLRGDTTRRTFITRFGQMTGMLAVSGPLLASMTDWAIAQQKLELADPASPLGQ